MTVLSRALIRRIIIQEMRKPSLSSGLTFDDDSEGSINIDSGTEIDDIPSFMGDDDYTDIIFPDIEPAYEDLPDIDNQPYGEPYTFEDKTELDIDTDMDDFGFEYDDDDDFEFESETEEDSESETEYNPGRQIMDMSAEEIRRHVTRQADELSPDMSARDTRTRAQMRYDDLARQGREAEMEDPEFLPTAELPPYEQRKKRFEEQVNKRIRQSIRRQILLL